MQPLAVVEDFDVVGDGEPCPRSGGEGLSLVHLVLQRPEEALGCGVVPAHAGPANAGANAVGLAELPELAGAILSGRPCRCGKWLRAGRGRG